MLRTIACCLALACGGAAQAQVATPQTFSAPPPPTVAQALAPTTQGVVLAVPVAPPAPPPVPTLGTPQTVVTASTQGQNGVGTAVLAVLVENPWIVDKILGQIGQCLAKRGQPKLVVTPPSTGQPSAGVGQVMAVPVTIVTQTQAASAAPQPMTVYMTVPAPAAKKGLLQRVFGH